MRNQITNLQLLQKSILEIPANDGCIEWNRGKERFGYGKVWVGSRTFPAHRVAYELSFGPIKDGLFVLHKCDNPACFRPDHLFTGTQGDNLIDRNKKGRANTPFAERHWNTKISTEQVLEIRQLRDSGEKQASIGKRYGVGQDVISRIMTGKTRTR